MKDEKNTTLQHFSVKKKEQLAQNDNYESIHSILTAAPQLQWRYFDEFNFLEEGFILI